MKTESYWVPEDECPAGRCAEPLAPGWVCGNLGVDGDGCRLHPRRSKLQGPGAAAAPAMLKQKEVSREEE